MRINEAVRTDIAHSVLCWLATVDESGAPSVTPKEIFASHGDDRIVVADIASSGSVRNIRARPTVCVGFVDVFRQRGFKITGQAEIVGPEDGRFAELSAELARMAGSAFPIRHVISIGVERIARIWAPSYKLLPEETEAEKMAAAYGTYGVRPADWE